MTDFRTADQIAAEEALKMRTLETIADASRRVFMRECQRDGIDPSKGVSPSLLKLLKGEGDYV